MATRAVGRDSSGRLPPPIMERPSLTFAAAPAARAPRGGAGDGGAPVAPLGGGAGGARPAGGAPPHLGVRLRDHAPDGKLLGRLAAEVVRQGGGEGGDAPLVH